MTEPQREPRSDLISFEPTVDDSPAFTVGLWGSQALLFALLLAGFTVLRGVSVDLTALVACAGMVWLGAVTAIVLRGRLQPRPRARVRLVAVVAVAAFAGWLIVFLAGALMGALSAAGVVWFDVTGLVLENAALVSAYFARMFRWRSDSYRG